MTTVPSSRTPTRDVPPVGAVPHGTTAGYNAGCRCTICSEFRQAAYGSLDIASQPKPKVAPKRRAGRGWTVRCVPPQSTVQTCSGATYQLQPGHLVAEWLGTTGLIHLEETTWDLIVVTDGAITALQEAQEEAKRVMPKAVMRDVATAAHLGGTVERPVHNPRRPPQKATIADLTAQITALVKDMQRFREPSTAQQAEFARRYGKLRDRMAELRKEFIEADGAFEIAQQQLVAFMEA